MPVEYEYTMEPSPRLKLLLMLLGDELYTRMLNYYECDFSWECRVTIKVVTPDKADVTISVHPHQISYKVRVTAEGEVEVTRDSRSTVFHPVRGLSRLAEQLAMYMLPERRE